MPQQLKLKLPGTLYVVDLTLNSETNTGKVVLERKAREAQKSLSDLSLGSIQNVLLDLLEAKGLHPNPRLISRVLESELEEAKLKTPVVTEEPSPATMKETPTEEPSPATKKTAHISADVALTLRDHLLKVKDVVAAASAQMSRLDTFIESPEAESTKKSIQNLLTQTTDIINNALST